MQFTDAVAVAGTRRRDDGYLVADARIARTGIQLYRGAEVGRPSMDVVRVYRPGAEVFSEDTMRSAAHRPVTNEHPPEMVTADNWRRYAVGQSADEVSGEGIYIRVPLMVSDAQAIKAIEDGKRELSAGYTCDVEFTPGVTDAGEAYDAIQKNIRMNHVAIVQRGRAGHEVRIGDGAAPWGISPMGVNDAEPDLAKAKRALRAAIALHVKHMNGTAPTTGKAGEKSQQAMMDMMEEALEALTGTSSPGGGMGSMDAHPDQAPSIHVADRKEPDMPDNLRTMMVDGLSVSTTDQGAQAIEKLLNDRKAAQDALATAQTDRAAALAAKDKDLATKDAEIDDLKGKVLDGAALDKLVAARASLVGTAKAIAPAVKTDGLSDADLRRAVVVAKVGDAAVKDRSDDYIAARFDILAEAAGQTRDAFREVVADGVATINDAQKALADAKAARLKHLNTAHSAAADAA